MSETVRRDITPRDEANLSWFFGPGAAYFEKSTFGIMLEQAVLFGQQSEPCERCGGLGFLELTAEEMVSRAEQFADLAEARRRDATSGQSQTHEEVERIRELRDQEHAKLSGQADCPDCKRSGLALSRVPVREGNAFAVTACCSRCRGRKVIASGDPCPVCSGAGYFEPVTINGDGADGESEGWCPEDESLMRYALVSRRIDRLSESAVEVLQLFYGDRGARCAGTKEGRLLVLYHLTPAGAKLAAKGISKEMRDALGEMGLRLDEAIWNECEAQRQKPNATRKSQIESAQAQAERLWCEAAREWAATAPPPKPATGTTGVV